MLHRMTSTTINEPLLVHYTGGQVGNLVVLSGIQWRIKTISSLILINNYQVCVQMKKGLSV